MVHENARLLVAWGSDTGGVIYGTPTVRSRSIQVGEDVSETDSAEIGLAIGKLTERQVAFLILLILDRSGELGSRKVAGKQRSQLLRFADYLGMTEHGIRKWLERSLARRPGHIVRWDHTTKGRQPSQTGGPWLLTVDKSGVVPDSKTALEFVDRQRRWTAMRRSDPYELLRDARRLQDRGNWVDALTMLEEAESMFQRRRWARDDPLWFEIRLTLGGLQMQLGDEELEPGLCHNIVRSVSRQRLGGVEADLVKARAHYLATLISAQRDDIDSTTKAFSHLERARELLRGHSGHDAVREYWRACSYHELMMARTTGAAQPKRTSAILQASRIIEESRDQKRMRYGESLICANRSADAVEYIYSARDSGRLSEPAWIIAERLGPSAEWGAGAKAGPTMEALWRAEKEASSAGFKHQVRLIRKQKRLVRKRKRDVVTR